VQVIDPKVEFHAFLWNWAGNVRSQIDLHPAGATASTAYGMAGTRQAGYAKFNGRSHAGLWNGGAASWVDLQPANATDSIAYGIAGTQQAGSATFGNVTHAGIWKATAASWVDLNPAGATNSTAYGIAGTQQVGYATFNNTTHAGLWKGSAASWIDLGLGQAHATTGAQQVGYAIVGPSQERHAALWSGAAGSLVDLNPSGATESVAYGIAGAFQAGYAKIGGEYRAGVWNGTAASWQALPFPDLGENEPFTGWYPNVSTSIWSEGSQFYASGYLARAGYVASLHKDIAVLWSRPVPSGLPGDFNNDGKADAADYVRWRKESIYGAQDYSDWRTNFGRALGSGGATLANAINSVSVPEPTSVGLLLLVCIGMLANGARHPIIKPKGIL
jgi:hypothetical protein